MLLIVKPLVATVVYARLAGLAAAIREVVLGERLCCSLLKETRAAALRVHRRIVKLGRFLSARYTPWDGTFLAPEHVEDFPSFHQPVLFFDTAGLKQGCVPPRFYSSPLEALHD